MLSVLQQGTWAFTGAEERLADEYRPPYFQQSQRWLALAVVGGFALSVSAVVIAIVLSIWLHTYDPLYLTALSAVAGVWGGITGSVVGFSFARQED